MQVKQNQLLNDERKDEKNDENSRYGFDYKTGFLENDVNSR